MDQPQRPGQAAQSAPQQGPVATQSTPGAAMLPPHMMNLMADPAMAAAASSIFPPAAMLNNPGAFFAMPQLFSPTGMPAPNSLSAAESGVATQMRANQAVPTAFNTNTSQNTGAAAAWAQPMITTSGGAMVPMQMGNAAGRTMPNQVPSSVLQAQLAAAAAAVAPSKLADPGKKKSDLTKEDKAKQNRDRNREHARSTRLRKKAYVQKLKELVEGLHAERSEEMRKRRVAVQHLADKQSVRRAVVRSFLRFHSSYETDPRKWMTLLEDSFWFKQPVTPYRSFRRVEIEQECRVIRDVDALIADAAGLSVMVEGIGSRSTRWMQIKREDTMSRGVVGADSQSLPHSILPQKNAYQHAMSSLSSSSGSSHGSTGDEDRRNLKRPHSETVDPPAKQSKESTNIGRPSKVSSSGSSNDNGDRQKSSNEFHVYNAPSIPDPMMLDSEGNSPEDTSQENESNSSSNGDTDAVGDTKQVTSDSSSGEEYRALDRSAQPSPAKRPKVETTAQSTAAITSGANSGAIAGFPLRSSLPANIARKGGISHSVRSVVDPMNIQNGSARLSLAPATPLPPFSGIGKRPSMTTSSSPTTVGVAAVRGGVPTMAPPSLGSAADSLSKLPSTSSMPGVATNSDSASSFAVPNPTLITADPDASSSSSNQSTQIRAYYHVNEDDMLLTDDVLMCPFIFRSQDAVLCGALAECIMPGMLRAHFSPRNKLMSLEMVYDAMGFMQQLERASGSEGTAQIVPGSLEMALSPNTNEARVITLASAPYRIVSVNEAWTRMTKYTQMEVEGRDLSILNGTRSDPDAALRPGKPPHLLKDVAQGRSACSTNIHYDKDGREFVEFVCSYPLTNTNDEITHLLHVCKELPMPTSARHEVGESDGSNGSEPNR